MTASPEVNDGTGFGQPHTAPDAGLEPLLWLQLLGIGAIAGEALALLVLLGSVDPGPLPELERLLIWALGALAPAVLLSKRLADPWSLLLLKAPCRGRRDIQRRLSRLQNQPALRLLPLLAAVLVLPAIWRIDQVSGLARALSPLTDSNRLVVLLLSVPILALIVWHVQQIGQALWLLSRPAAAINTVDPLTINELERERLSLGLPLLLVSPLRPDARPPGRPSPPPAAAASEAPPGPQPVQPSSAPVSQDPGQIPVEGQPTNEGASPGSSSQEFSTPIVPLTGPAEDQGALRRASTTEDGSEGEAGSDSVTETANDREIAGGSDQDAIEHAQDEAAAAELPLTASEQASLAGEQTLAGEPGQEPAEGSWKGDGPWSAAGAIEPEQTAEDGEGGDLDQQIAAHEA